MRSSGNINAPKWELTEACSRQPGPGACSLCEYVSLHLELAKTWKMKSRMGWNYGTSTVATNAQEQEESWTGLRNAGQALTHVARHVRQKTRILPLDQTHRLLVLHLRDRRPFCFPLHGFQDRGEYICFMSTNSYSPQRQMKDEGEGCSSMHSLGTFLTYDGRMY